MRGSSFRQFAPISANGDSETHSPDLDNSLYADNHGITFRKDAGVTAFTFQLFGSYFKPELTLADDWFPVSSALPFGTGAGEVKQHRVVDFPVVSIKVAITGYTGSGNIYPVYLGARGS